MKTNWLKISLIIICVVIAIPIILIGGYLGTSFFCYKYTIYQLHKAVPDAYKYDNQIYETDNGAYQADFYKFSECNEDFIRDWETKVTDDYTFKTCTIKVGVFRQVIVINTVAKCATVEYHCTFFE